MDNLQEKVLIKILNKLSSSNLSSSIIPCRYDNEQITENQKIQSQCNTISFWNKSNMTVFINGIPLEQGQPMLTFGNQANLIDMTNWSIKFDESTASGTPYKDLHVIRRVLEGEFTYQNVTK